MKPNRYTGFLIDPLNATIGPVSIFDPVDQYQHHPQLQLRQLLGARTLHTLHIDLAGHRHLIWHDAQDTESYWTAMFQINQSQFLASRAIVFADDNKDEFDKDASPFGIEPKLSLGELAELTTCIQPIIVPRMREDQMTGFDLALVRKRPAIIS
ncbi:hypothetical protein CFBP4996_26285 (plasmid) [Agrobacterium leguminum]|uniref:hypothetical protein n=1 Tax=Agrobacterium leguminum TaxID=2792015 RepID=UPI0010C9C8B6|nr:hypothetical protein [Agrobacterium leguminum]WFS69584.1 hypothetical protein CFBP4996_26285 [Agrobacterium leguminum]